MKVICFNDELSMEFSLIGNKFKLTHFEKNVPTNIVCAQLKFNSLEFEAKDRKFGASIGSMVLS